jgi:hypothetical protein
MSLILPPFAFAHCTDNYAGGTPPVGASPGTAVTAGGSANADGTQVSLIAALAHDVHYLVVGVGGASSPSAIDTAALLDILVDPAGGTTWASFIDDLVCGVNAALTAGTVGMPTYYHFPIWLPAGASLGAQVRCATLSHPFRVAIWAYGNPSRPESWWCGQRVESLGIDAANSKGTDITPGSTTATFTFTNVGSTTAARYGAIQFGMNGSDSVAAALGYYAQIGIGGARVPGTPTFYWANSTGEAASRSGHNGPIPCDIPAGTQLQVGACSSGSAEVHDVALYGVY